MNLLSIILRIFKGKNQIAFAKKDLTLMLVIPLDSPFYFS
jgi:hypothetical protein